MADVVRDLPALLDWTGNALIVGGAWDGQKWTIQQGDGESGWYCWTLDLHWSRDRLLEEAESTGGRVAAVIADGAPQPPVGSKVQRQRPDGLTERVWTREPHGYWQCGEVFGFAWSAVTSPGRVVEILALPASEVATSAGEAANSVAAEARQLTDTADWETIAAWCGGTVINRTDGPGADPYTVIDGRDDYGQLAFTACEGDWVVRDGHITAVVRGRFADAILAAREAK